MGDAVVLDASALIAAIRAEPGADRVHDVLQGALISSVNLAEVATLMIRAGATRTSAALELLELPIEVSPATANHALDAAALLPLTRSLGLSLGDRFCIALGMAEKRPILTADRAWAGLHISGATIELIR